jgi:hypothetical protein
LDLEAESEAIGLGKIPGAKVQAGLACAIEQPDTGFLPKPCRTLREYSPWVGLTWRP